MQHDSQQNILDQPVQLIINVCRITQPFVSIAESLFQHGVA